jgi:RNA polymerase sigma-70 factor (ECF subfamily)
MRFLRRNWRHPDDITDLRQEVYVRIYEAAEHNRPALVQPFVFAVARNLLIDRARRGQIVAIDSIADMAELDVWVDELTPERHATGRSELRLLQAALETLPARCREVVTLRKIDGMSQRDVAGQMGITENTVERQVSNGMRALAAALLSRGMHTGMEKFIHKIRKGRGAA